MLVKGLFTNVSGSIGGVTGSRNKGGQYLRGRTTPTNPNSTAQQLVRSAFSDATSAWSALLAVNRGAWNDYAALQSWTNALGDPIQLSGQQAYIGAYSASMSAGLTPSVTPPAPNTRPAAYVIEEMAPDLTTTDVGEDITSGNLLAVDRLVIAVSGPLPPGLTSPKVAFRNAAIAAGNENAGSLSALIYTAITNRNPTATVNQRFAVRIRGVRLAGNYSPFSTRVTLPMDET